MDKREFLKTSGVLFASTLFSKLTTAQTAAGSRTNWAGNYAYSAKNLDLANSTEDVRHSILGHSHLKALGARHSFNGIADSSEEQISLKHFDQIELNAKTRTVTVGAGVTYGQLAPYIDSRGFAVHNLASLPHISVVGACATATHGSGNKNGNLSTAVRAMEIVTAKGDVVTFSREKLGGKFPGTVVGLGALGVITKITLEVQPTFQMTQVVYENLSFSQLEHHLEDISGVVTASASLRTRRIIALPRSGSSAALIRVLTPTRIQIFIVRSQPLEICIRLPGTRPKIVPNRWAYLDRGTNGSHTFA
jgi:xylitol oxidase